MRPHSYNKYSNKKTVIDNITFDSIKESKQYVYLKLLQHAGEISRLAWQPKFLLQDKFVDWNKETQRAIYYIADFSYWDKLGRFVVEDCKGMKTEVYKLKKKLFLYKYPLYIFREL